MSTFEKPNWTNINFEMKQREKGWAVRVWERERERERESERKKTKSKIECIWNDSEDRRDATAYNVRPKCSFMYEGKSGKDHERCERAGQDVRWKVKREIYIFPATENCTSDDQKDNKPYMVALDNTQQQQQYHDQEHKNNKAKFNSIAMEIKLFFSLCRFFSLPKPFCSRRGRRCDCHCRLFRSFWSDFKGQRFNVCVSFFLNAIRTHALWKCEHFWIASTILFGITANTLFEWQNTFFGNFFTLFVHLPWLLGKNLYEIRFFQGNRFLLVTNGNFTHVADLMCDALLTHKILSN